MVEGDIVSIDMGAKLDLVQHVLDGFHILKINVKRPAVLQCDPEILIQCRIRQTCNGIDSACLDLHASAIVEVGQQR